jgi:beta-lactamase class A
MSTVIEAELSQAFADAGVAGAFHAIDIDTGAELGHRADEPSVLASVFKVPILVTLLRAADEGTIDLTEQVTVPLDGRAPGPTGISVMTDPVTLSWRDLARWMIVVSDNAATDIVLERVGIENVNAAMKELGLTGTDIRVDCRGIFATILEDAGLASFDDLPTQPSAQELDTWRALTPLETNHGTPRDMTRLLTLLWTDQAASAELCELGRQILLQQVWPHRLASGFPEDDVVTGGKTGTLPRVRNEAGVVVRADGRRFAVATFTTATSTGQKNPAADAMSGRAARIAVDALLTA